MSTDSTPPPAPPGDVMTSWLRTTVPTLWGATAAAALSALGPSLPDALAGPLSTLLTHDSTSLLVTVASVAAWHAAWRRAEPHVPRWVARLVLGSARRPSYSEQRSSPET